MIADKVYIFKMNERPTRIYSTAKQAEQKSTDKKHTGDGEITPYNASWREPLQGSDEGKAQRLGKHAFPFTQSDVKHNNASVGK